MKIISLLASLTLAGLITAASPAITHAQQGGRFSIKSTVIAGGGLKSASANRRFQMSATVGQPEAAPVLKSDNSRFAVEPGFWHGITVVQTQGSPLLRIRAGASGTVILSWPVASTGFVLEETSALGAVKWTPTQATVVDTATEHTITVPAAGIVKCYRLRGSIGTN